MAGSFVLTSSLSATIEEMDDGSWTCTHPGLGLVVGGRTSDEAAQKLLGAFSFLIDTLSQRGGINAVKGRLERGGVQCHLDKPDPDKRSSLPFQLALSKVLDPV